MRGLIHLRAFAERLGARVAGAGLNAVSVLLVAKQQGPVAFGRFTLGFSIGIMVVAGLGLGATTRALRIKRESEPVAMASSLSFLRAIGSAVAMIVVAVSLAWMGVSWPFALSVGVVAAVEGYADFEQACRAGFLEHRSSSAVLLVQRVLPAIAVCVAYVLGTSTVVALGAACALVAVWLARRPILRHEGSWAMRSAIRGSFGYWGGAVAQSVQQLDMSIVRWTTGALGVGTYGAAVRTTSPIGLVVNSAVVALAPSFGQIEDPLQRRQRFARFTWLAALFGLGLAITSPIIADVAVWLLGDSYAAARPIIIGLVVATGIGSIVQVQQAHLYIEGRAGVSATVMTVSVIVGLLALILAGRFLGHEWLWLGLLTCNSLCAALLLAESTLFKPQADS